MMYSGDEEYGDDITSGVDKPVSQPREIAVRPRRGTMSGWKRNAIARKLAEESTTLRTPEPILQPEPAPSISSVQELGELIIVALQDGSKKIAEVRGWLKHFGRAFDPDAVTVAVHELVVSGRITFNSDAKVYEVKQR